MLYSFQRASTCLVAHDLLTHKKGFMGEMRRLKEVACPPWSPSEGSTEMTKGQFSNEFVALFHLTSTLSPLSTHTRCRGVCASEASWPHTCSEPTDSYRWRRVFPKVYNQNHQVISKKTLFSGTEPVFQGRRPESRLLKHHRQLLCTLKCGRLLS